MVVNVLKKNKQKSKLEMEMTEIVDSVLFRHRTGRGLAATIDSNL